MNTKFPSAVDVSGESISKSEVCLVSFIDTEESYND